MAAALQWTVGYLIALAWAWGGVWLFGGFEFDGENPEGSPGAVAAALAWFAIPAAGLFLARRRSPGFKRPLFDGMAFGGLMVAAFLVVLVVLVVSIVGLVFAWLLTHPVGMALFFTLPPLAFGWFCYLHGLGRVSAAPSGAAGDD